MFGCMSHNDLSNGNFLSFRLGLTSTFDYTTIDATYFYLANEYISCVQIFATNANTYYALINLNDGIINNNVLITITVGSTNANF